MQRHTKRSATTVEDEAGASVHAKFDAFVGTLDDDAVREAFAHWLVSEVPELASVATKRPRRRVQRVA